MCLINKHVMSGLLYIAITSANWLDGNKAHGYFCNEWSSCGDLITCKALVCRQSSDAEY